MLAHKRSTPTVGPRLRGGIFKCISSRKQRDPTTSNDDVKNFTIDLTTVNYEDGEDEVETISDVREWGGDDENGKAKDLLTEFWEISKSNSQVEKPYPHKERSILNDFLNANKLCQYETTLLNLLKDI